MQGRLHLSRCETLLLTWTGKPTSRHAATFRISCGSGRNGVSDSVVGIGACSSSRLSSLHEFSRRDGIVSRARHSSRNTALLLEINRHLHTERAAD